jgi:cell division protein FtsB
VPVDTQTTLTLLVEIKRLIHVVGGMALEISKQQEMLERQTARIVDLQTHIENFDGEDR